MENKFFKTQKILDNVTLITGLGGVNAYLVEGSERALLIDGMTGTGSLKEFVGQLTNLPVSLVLTHGHIDHIGAAFEFDECFINPADIVMMYNPEHAAQENRFGFATMGGHVEGVTLEDTIPPTAVKTYPVYTGDVFDLGGTCIEVVQIPGHTFGTIVLLDRDNRVLYSGDACNGNTLLSMTGSASIEEYLESLKAFKAYDDAYDVMWGGHGPMSVPKSIIDDGIKLCQEIIARTDDAIPTPSIGGGMALLAKEREGFRPKGGGLCNIVYSDQRIKKMPKKTIKGTPEMI